MAAILKLLQREETPAAVPLLLLATVLVAAARFGVLPGMVAALASFAAYNFLFVEPLYTLRVTHAADVAALAVFLLTAGLTGWLAGRLRDEADSARRRAIHLDRIAQLTNALSQATSQQAALEALAREAHALTSDAAYILQGSPDAIATEFALPPNSTVADDCLPAAARAFTYHSVQPPAAYGSANRQLAFYPIEEGGRVHHVFAAAFPETARGHVGEIDNTLRQMAAQAGQALERIRRAAEADIARLAVETEQLRSGLLLSLSHDLRTPLAGILGSVSSLREPTLQLSKAARDDLLAAAEEEARRLARYVDDLLALTRLQSGLKPDLQPVGLNDIAASALSRAATAHPSARFEFRQLQSGAAINTDAALLGQALFNLLDNAVRHGPPHEPVSFVITSVGNNYEVTVRDNGSGISQAEAARIFDPLFRGKDSKGTGLGLAIVKSVVTVLGGTVKLVSPLTGGRGTAFVISLPDKP